MHQRWYDAIPACLKWSEQSRNDLLEHAGCKLLELLTGPCSLEIQPQHVLQAIRKEFLPCICISVFLRQVTVIGDNVESELAIGRNSILMKLGQLLAEDWRFW